MNKKEAFAADEEIKKTMAQIDGRRAVAKRLLEDHDLVGMLGLKLDRARFEKVIERFTDQLDTLEQQHRELINEAVRQGWGDDLFSQ